MRARLLGGAVAAAATLAACRAPAVEGTGTASPEAAMTATDTTARGVLYVAGSDPAPTVALRRDGASALALTGPLTDELRRLSGAEVEVRGTPGTGGPGPSIEVREYTVLAIDGRRPRVGVVSVPSGTASGGTVQLAESSTGATVTLADPDGVLARLDGATVWVLVEETPAAGAAPRVQSYGVVREPTR